MLTESRLKNNIFLIGFMGCGKSTVANYLKENYGLCRVEMDDKIVEEVGMTIPDIFKLRGEEFFRDAESDLLGRMIMLSNMVASCGGGTPLRQKNVDMMRSCGKIVFLTARPETILERVKDNHDRPLLENNKTVEYIEELLNKRKDIYTAAADIIIETDGKSVEDICKEIIEKTGLSLS
jgi:shikimate kinase